MFALESDRPLLFSQYFFAALLVADNGDQRGHSDCGLSQVHHHPDGPGAAHDQRRRRDNRLRLLIRSATPPPFPPVMMQSLLSVASWLLSLAAAAVGAPQELGWPLLSVRLIFFSFLILVIFFRLPPLPGVFAVNSPGLTIRKCIISAGSGADGNDGADAPNTAASAGTECERASGAPCLASGTLITNTRFRSICCV